MLGQRSLPPLQLLLRDLIHPPEQRILAALLGKEGRGIEKRG